MPLPEEGVNVATKPSFSSSNASALIFMETLAVVSPAAKVTVWVAPSKSSGAVAPASVSTISTDAATGVPFSSRSRVTEPAFSSTETSSESSTNSTMPGVVESVMVTVAVAGSPTTVVSSIALI